MKIISFFAALALLSAPAQAQRTVLTADVTMHVAPPSNCTNGYWPGSSPVAVAACGSDTTGDGTQSAPFATPQKAHDALAAEYDLQGKWRATIQLAVANAPAQFMYPGLQISGRLVGQAGGVAPLKFGSPPQDLHIGKYAPYTVRGDPSNVNGAFFTPGLNGFPTQACLSISETAVALDGVTCATWGASDCIEVFANAYLDLGRTWFGGCGEPSLWPVIAVAWNSAVMVTGEVTLTGSALAFMQVAHSTVQGNSDSGSASVPITIMNNPQFTHFFIVDHSVVYAYTMSFSGSINGTKALVLRNGALFTNTGDLTPKSCFTQPGTQNFIPGTWNAATMVEGNAECR